MAAKVTRYLTAQTVKRSNPFKEGQETRQACGLFALSVWTIVVKISFTHLCYVHTILSGTRTAWKENDTAGNSYGDSGDRASSLVWLSSFCLGNVGINPAVFTSLSKRVLQVSLPNESVKCVLCCEGQNETSIETMVGLGKLYSICYTM